MTKDVVGLQEYSRFVDATARLQCGIHRELKYPSVIAGLYSKAINSCPTESRRPGERTVYAV